MNVTRKIFKNSLYGIYSRNGGFRLPKTFMRKASIDKIFKRDGWKIINL